MVVFFLKKKSLNAKENSADEEERAMNKQLDESDWENIYGKYDTVKILNYTYNYIPWCINYI